MHAALKEASKNRREAARYRPGSPDHEYRIRAAARLEQMAADSMFAEQEQAA